MAAKYDYDSVDDFVKDRAFETHVALKGAVGSEVKFGQILRNVMKHAYLCGEFSKGDAAPDVTYE